MWTYIDKAGGVANAIREIAGDTLTLQTGQGVKFGSGISPSTPARLTCYRGTTFLGILKCVGVTGDDLDIDGPADDYDDFQVQVGDKVGNVWVAGDANDIWEELNGKEPSLPSTTPTGKFLRDDKTWQNVSTGLPTDLHWDAINKRLGISASVPESTLDVWAHSTENLATFRNSSGDKLVEILANGGFAPVTMRFRLARYIDLAAGTSVTLPYGAEYAGTVKKVTVLATTNPVGGGFTFDIKKNGTSIFAAPKVIAANMTSLQKFTTFVGDPTPLTVNEDDQFTIDISSPGTGVQNVVITLTYLARNR